ncbi:hypothetical protein C8R43DRAFT_193878 [Mycena crocata]|nr:hypothetical protein C8R43DRAFT_193878 [Mycena crocata]
MDTPSPSCKLSAHHPSPTLTKLQLARYSYRSLIYTRRLAPTLHPSRRDCARIVSAGQNDSTRRARLPRTRFCGVARCHSRQNDASRTRCDSGRVCASGTQRGTGRRKGGGGGGGGCRRKLRGRCTSHLSGAHRDGLKREMRRRRCSSQRASCALAGVRTAVGCGLRCGGAGDWQRTRSQSSLPARTKHRGGAGGSRPRERASSGIACAGGFAIAGGRMLRGRTSQYREYEIRAGRYRLRSLELVLLTYKY